MGSRLPKHALVALSLTIAVTIMAFGGSALAQGGGPGVQPNLRLPAPAAGGSLRDEPENEATDQPATQEEAVEPASNEAHPASAPSADEPPADAHNETADESEPEQPS